MLNYLLTENGVDPAGVDVQWLTAQEVTANMLSSEDGVCMLPVPAATALLMKDSGVRQALSLTLRRMVQGAAVWPWAASWPAPTISRRIPGWNAFLDRLR